MKVKIYTFKDIERELKNYCGCCPNCYQCGYFDVGGKCINKYISSNFN